MTSNNTNNKTTTAAGSSSSSIAADLLCINCIAPNAALSAVVSENGENNKKEKNGDASGVPIPNQLCGIDIGSLVSNPFGNKSTMTSTTGTDNDIDEGEVGRTIADTTDGDDAAAAGGDEPDLEDLDKALADLDIPDSDAEDEMSLEDDAIAGGAKAANEKSKKKKKNRGFLKSVRNVLGGGGGAGDKKTKTKGSAAEKKVEEPTSPNDDEKKDDDDEDTEKQKGETSFDEEFPNALMMNDDNIKGVEEQPEEQQKKDPVDSHSTISQRPFSEREIESITTWKERLQRDEVYSLRYRPNDEENLELNELASYVGIERIERTKAASSATLSPQPNKKKQQSQSNFWGGVSSPFASSSNSDSTSLSTLMTPDPSQKQPQSIILKRGPVWLNDKSKNKKKKEAKPSSKESGDAGDHEYELVLLTHGFILIEVPEKRDDDEDNKPQDLGASLSNMMGFATSTTGPAPYDVCKLWRGVHHVQDNATMDGTGTVSWGFSIVFGDPKGDDKPGSKGGANSIEFGVGCQAAMESWLVSVGHILIQNALHNPNLRELTESFGWQYKLLQRPGYTAAVTGSPDDLFSLFNSMMIAEVEVTSVESKKSGSGTGTTTKDRLNILDSYHEMAPLHYAIQQHPVNKDIIEALLQSGADPNLPDGENKSSMYYAERNELDEAIIELMKGFGGQKSELTETEARGELFGGIEDANRKIEHRRQVEKVVQENKAAEVAKKAESAQSAMGDAMNALVQRGEKINEMGDKANELLDGAKDYGDMAKTLKETMKAKKKRWL